MNTSTNLNKSVKRVHFKSGEALLTPLGILVVIAIWYWATNFTDAKIIMPSPEVVLKKIIASLYEPMGKYTLPHHIGFSLRRVLIGFGLSTIAGLTVGILMGCSETLEAAIRPIFELVRPIPGIAWIPMAILWFGIGETTKYFIIFMGGFAHLVVNTYSGARRVDPQLIGVARMLGASQRQIFINVVIPSCIPYIFAGLQVSLSTSWMAVLAAEMVSSTEGAGWIIVAGMETGNTAQILVGIISIAVVGLMLATIMRGVEKKLCSWKVKGA